MSPEKVTRLKVTLEAALTLDGGKADRKAVASFLATEKGREKFSGGAYHLTLLGITGTSTVSIPAALASWIRKAERKLEQSNG